MRNGTNNRKTPTISLIQNSLKALKKTHRFRQRDVFDSLIDFASNDYLCLANNKKTLKKTYKLNRTKENNFYYYAISEVIRRLIEMFKLTIKKNDKKWNHVIPIQLGHLNECKILFLDQKNKFNFKKYN